MCYSHHRGPIPFLNENRHAIAVDGDAAATSHMKRFQRICHDFRCFLDNGWHYLG